MRLKQIYLELLYFVCIHDIGISHLMHQSDSSYYIGEFPYRNIISFVKGAQSCGISYQNISSLFNGEDKDQEASDIDYNCLLFINNHPSEDNASLHVSDVNAEFQAYGVQYQFKINPYNCTTPDNYQNLKLFLKCIKQREYVGKTCINGKGCDDDKEICQPHSDFKKTVCIPKRRYNESCNMHSQCYGNTNCQQAGEEFLCRCKEGFEFINGECLKVEIPLSEECNDSRQCTGSENAKECVFNTNKMKRVCSCEKPFLLNRGKCLERDRRLYEPCESSLQCKGSFGATECRYVDGVKLCYCPYGHGIFRGACLKVGLVMGKFCLANEQCTGTKNAQQCKPDNETEKSLCVCNPGFIRHDAHCLQVNKTLYEDCLIDDQCNGTAGMGVCKKVRDRKLCMCASDFVEDKETLTCRKANKCVFDSCKINEQCTGTENARVCRFNEEQKEHICTCDDTFIWHQKRCILSERHLFDSCEYDIQCNGTEDADFCTAFGKMKVCYCKPGHVEYNGRCIQDKIRFGDLCEIDKQCAEKEDNVICGKNWTCTCNDGYLRVDKQCVIAGRKMFESCIFDIQCTGTPNATRCKSVGEVQICHCNIGQFEFEGRCFQGDKKMDDTCEIGLQCNGTKHASVCGENLTCICDVGFLVMNETCIIYRYLSLGNLSVGQSCVHSSQCTGTENSRCVVGKCLCEMGFVLDNLQCVSEKMPLPWISEKKNQLVLVGTGGSLFVIFISFIICLIVFRRKWKSQNKRLDIHTADNVPEDHNYYTYAIHDNFRDIMKNQISPNINNCSNTGDIYDTTRHTEEQQTENIYDVTEPLSTFRGQASSEGVYMYNHLHDKETQLCENLYDVTETIPVTPETDA